VDGLTLLQQAREAGLAVKAEADKLVIRGPKCAEPVALLLIESKPKVLAALGEAGAWQARHREALAHWGVLHPANEAAQLAWREMQVRWHFLHGQRVPEWQCAGCGERIGGQRALDLGRGARVHFETLNCLRRYGDRWRRDATEWLFAMGLKPPAEAQ